MAFLIDTSVLVELERRREAPELERLIDDQANAISVVTVSELLHGALRAPEERRIARLAFVDHLLARIEAVPISETIARLHAHLWSELVADGRMLGPHDLWIGATALSRDLTVATLDERDFRRVPGLAVVVPG